MGPGQFHGFFVPVKPAWLYVQVIESERVNERPQFHLQLCIC
jgi:hypothetical protein